MPSLLQQALRRKPVSELTAETGTDTGGGELERSIGLFQLSMIGIGATIGTGIFFVLSAGGADRRARPSSWSFVVAGVVAGLTAVCYAELASAVPVSGSSYSYAYATLGEVVAMGVAACLLLEYGVSAAAVAVGWSEYLNQLLDNLFGVQLPDAISNSPESGGILNLPAVVLVALCALLLIRGRQRVGEGQRDDGAHQARRAGAVHRDRRAPAGTRRTSPTFAPVRLRRRSLPRPGSSSSRSSASTRCRRPVRRSRTRGATCRWRS